MNNLGFNIYIIFTISWFLHMGSRLPVLGVMRFDLILVCILFLISIKRRQPIQEKQITKIDQLIRILFIYIIITIPFVQWPGTVVRFGIETLIKAVVFYYFTSIFIDTETKLKKFILIFVICQLFRILEPLYLNITQGYWGTTASMANWELLNRLSGAPSDTVNPNGLAFIICTVLPFLYYGASFSWFNKVTFLIFAPLCIYALTLTGSRSGFLGLITIFLTILIKSNKRFLLGVVGISIVIVGFPLLDSDMQDRYLSTFGMGEKNLGTAEGRTEGVKSDLIVALRRPVFGHGISTSREANAHFRGVDQLSHNLYTEVAQELGFFGLIIFILLIKSIFATLMECKKAAVNQANISCFLPKINDAMQTWLWLNLIFSFASYGLTSYEWYLLGGFAVVMQNLVKRGKVQKSV